MGEGLLGDITATLDRIPDAPKPEAEADNHRAVINELLKGCETKGLTYCLPVGPRSGDTESAAGVILRSPVDFEDQRVYLMITPDKIARVGRSGSLGNHPPRHYIEQVATGNGSVWFPRITTNWRGVDYLDWGSLTSTSKSEELIQDDALQLFPLPEGLDANAAVLSALSNSIDVAQRETLAKETGASHKASLTGSVQEALAKIPDSPKAISS